MDELLTPENVTRLWGRTPADDKVYAQQQRQAHLARVRAEIQANTYETPEKLDVALDRMIDRQVENARAEWDRTNTADRFE